jgi:hypothetical protein
MWRKIIKLYHERQQYLDEWLQVETRAEILPWLTLWQRQDAWPALDERCGYSSMDEVP